MNHSNFEILDELKKVMNLAKPGPNIFVLTFSCNRFTREEQACIDEIERFFGKYVIIDELMVITHSKTSVTHWTFFSKKLLSTH